MTSGKLDQISSRPFKTYVTTLVLTEKAEEVISHSLIGSLDIRLMTRLYLRTVGIRHDVYMKRETTLVQTAIY